MARIFICYRRENARGYAGRIYDHLRTMYPEKDLFYDRESLKPGEPWPGYIKEQFRDCEFLLVVIQKDWHKTADPESGKRRLDDPVDWVRLEIEAGLSRQQTKVVPVLVGDESRVPRADWLPASLHGLVGGQSYTLDEQDFRGAVKKLADHMGGAAAQEEPKAGPEEPAGRRAHEVCDRTPQRTAFQRALESKERRPWAFILQGGRLQSHESLVTYLEQRVDPDQKLRIRPSGGSLVWQWDSASEEPLIRPQVFQRFNAADAKGLEDALERNRDFEFVCLHHTIVTSARRPSALDAVRSHLSWWDSIRLGDGHPIPLLFFSIVHDSSFLGRMWWRWRMRAFEKTGYQSVQVRLFDTLANVNRGHVWEYFIDRNIGTLTEREAHLKALFEKHRSKPMAEVEEYLDRYFGPKGEKK